MRLLSERKRSPTPDHYKRAYIEASGETPAESQPWPEVIRPLLRQWELHQTGLSQVRKKEMLDRVLINFGNDEQALPEKLAALARAWAGRGRGEGSEAEAAEPEAPVTEVAPAVAMPLAPDHSPMLRALGEHLNLLAKSCDTRWPEVAAMAADLARDLDARTDMTAELLGRWTHVWQEVLLRAEDDFVLTLGLRRLVGLLFLNIGELVGDEAWVSGQLAAMENLLKGNLQPAVLLEAERGLRELAFKQGVLKGGLDEAKEKLRNLISTFIDRVGEMSLHADGFHARFDEYSVRIGKAAELSEVSDIVEGLSADMAGMRDALGRSHQDLVEARAQAEQAQERMHEMELELAMVSNLVREDQLTGALNRRGLDEAFSRELARTERLNTRLAISMLDIDHFKKLNDSLGHQAGDRALRHLADVIRSLLRPTDSLARYGGEEFLILLPNTDLEEAVKVLLRVQRELTKQFFLHNNERVLITFSAGVAEHLPGESEAALIERTDAAMYRAKRAGRNRVETG
ncbi:MAG: GGDEF domain-containing protein [Betaproteobacteria bacterium]|nr:GGDEF domain-containing protein [Betaproteobacteria bacterium]